MISLCIFYHWGKPPHLQNLKLVATMGHKLLSFFLKKEKGGNAIKRRNAKLVIGNARFVTGGRKFFFHEVRDLKQSL